MNQLPSIRLRPTESQFLSTQGFSSGVVFYNAEKNTLTVMDGNTKGGFELLRADLSNITGGSGGSGVVDFGSRIIRASSFQGDGSLLTNLPIPPNLVNSTQLTTAINNAVGLGYAGEFAFYPTDGRQLGSTGTNMVWNQSTDTLTVQNLSVTGSLLASITLTSIGFPTGVVVNEFSPDGTLANNSDSAVPTQKATKTYVDTALSGLDLSASGQVNTGTGGRLTFYASNGKAVDSTSADLTWDNIAGLLTVKEISDPIAVIRRVTADDPKYTQSPILSSDVKRVPVPVIVVLAEAVAEPVSLVWYGEMSAVKLVPVEPAL
jgi:hypothetical protein